MRRDQLLGQARAMMISAAGEAWPEEVVRQLWLGKKLLTYTRTRTITTQIGRIQ